MTKAKRIGSKERKAEMKMKVVLDPGAKMPTRAHDTDAGLDLYSPVYATIYPADVEATFGGFFGDSSSSVCIDTGVHVEIPVGYVGMIKSKSGLNVNHGITSEGVIDAGYTGSICVKLYNHGSKAVEIQKGQKISQLVLLPIITPELEQVDSLEETERGTGGFGSTGAF
jgi:dUTP pyrophosphatase